MSDDITNLNGFDLNRNQHVCERAAQLLVHSTACATNIREIADADEEFLANHLIQCDSCRLEAVQMGEVVAQLRSWNTRMGGPSRRFQERLRTRLHNERNATVPKDFASLYRDFPSGNSPKTNYKVPNKNTNVSNAVRREPSAQPRRLSQRITKGRSRRSLLFTILGLSLALNVFWLVNRVATRDVSAKSQTVVDARQSLETRLLRLRNSQAPDGLIDSDPVTTAWWLIAESRAVSQHLAVTTPNKLSIESAQNALRQNSQSQINNNNSPQAARFVIAAGLQDSAAAFSSNGQNPKLPTATAQPERRSNARGFDASSATRQVANASPGEPLLANSLGLLNFMSASKGNKEKFTAGVFSELSKADPVLAKNQSISCLVDMRASSLRAEALCALATASLIAE